MLDVRVKCEFFYNHIEVEEQHGLHGLNRVIVPIVEVQPEAAPIVKTITTYVGAILMLVTVVLIMFSGVFIDLVWPGYG